MPAAKCTQRSSICTFAVTSCGSARRGEDNRLTAASSMQPPCRVMGRSYWKPEEIANGERTRSRIRTKKRVREGVQVTSRSGVLKPARSRVVIGENANGGRGLAQQLQALSSKLQGKATAFATDQHGRGQLTSRSGVLKAARSRVV